MEEQIVKVNAFVGPSYTDGFIGFRYDQEVVPYSLGNHHGSVYHLNMGIIELFSSYFPNCITSFDRKKDRVSEWGPKTEIGICKLMMEDKMKLHKAR